MGSDMMDPKKKEDNLTIIVAIVGLIIFILLTMATSVLWNAANPPPKFPAAADIPTAPDTILPAVPATNPHHNVTEMYLRTHNADSLAFPQNLSDPYEANYVPLDTARMHAAIEMARMMPVNASGDFPTYGPLPVPGDPTIVFDEVTGKRVCYDFYSAPSPSNRAFVTIAANRLLGHSFIRAGFTNSDNEQMSLDKAQGYYEQTFSGYEIRSVRFVSGCWGKIVQMKIISPDSKERTVNMDYWGIVDERRCGSSTDDIPQKEIPALIAKWNESATRYRDIEDRLRMEGVNLSAPSSPDDATRIQWIMIKSW